jgi:[protein-PII] uridylyltransferase
VLSVADARATGEESWTSWRGYLLRQLYQRAAAALDQGEPDLAERARLSSALAGRVDPQLIEAHLEGMPPGYLLNFGSEVVAEHVLLTHPHPDRDEVRVAVKPGAPVAIFTVVARDRPGLLATVTGVLALHNLAVLEARVATRPDGVALDTFRVIDARGGDMVGPARWPGVRADLERAMVGELDVGARLAQKQAAYGDEVPEPAEVMTSRRGNQITIEVRSADRIGLLHDLAGLLTGLSLDVQWAKIDTRGSRVVDVFSVRDEKGDDPGREEMIRRVIGSAGQPSV